MANILIVGCGDIGYPTALNLHQQGHRVVGLRRHPPAGAAPFPMVAADIRDAASLYSVPVDFDAVLFIVAPDQRQPEQYQAVYDNGLGNLLAHFAAGGKKPSWLMVSSTSVYGQNDGEWVDEDSPATGDSPTSRWLAAAEQRLWAAGDSRHCVVRFAGIYGPGRDWLIRRVASGEPIQQQPPNYTNRTHRDDCVAVLLFLINKQLAGESLQSCYLACDDDPAPLSEVMFWIAKQYGYPVPPVLAIHGDAGQNKRCRNARLKALGFVLKYPSYRDGYRTVR